MKLRSEEIRSSGAVAAVVVTAAVITIATCR